MAWLGALSIDILLFIFLLFLNSSVVIQLFHIDTTVYVRL